MISPIQNMKPKNLLPLSAALLALLFGTSGASAQTSADHAAELLKKNDLPAAEALLAPLTGADSKDAAAFFQLGQLRLRQQKANEAVAAFEKATVLDSTRPEYFSQLGIAISMKMQGANFMVQAVTAPKMKKAFEKAVALDPNHIGGLIGLARYYSNAPEIAGGSLEKAAEFATRVQKLNPSLGESELGRIAERGEDFASALGHYEAADKLRPGQAGTILASGRMLAKLGRTDEARARFEAALKINPELESAKKALAELSAPAVSKG